MTAPEKRGYEMVAPAFEEVRQRAYDGLVQVHEKLRSDWLYDDQGPTHEQVEALDEARKHVAAARAALSKAAAVPVPLAPGQVAEEPSSGWRRLGRGR
jgi:hypothetical protein